MLSGRLRLAHRQHPIGSHSGNRLPLAAGPPNLDSLHLRCFTEPEMRAWVIRCQIAGRRADGAKLLPLRGNDANPRADAVAIAGGALKLHDEPVIAVGLAVEDR